MNPPETFPHRKDTAYGMSPDCRCGADDAGAVGIGATWGTDCPAALREALEAAREERDALTALRQYMRRAIADDIDMSEAFELLNALAPDDVASVMAWADAMELARDTPGPHIPPALLRRVEALGLVPGSGEPVGWLVGYVEGMAALLTTAQGERDELAATLADLHDCATRMRRSLASDHPDAVRYDNLLEALAARSAGGGGP